MTKNFRSTRRRCLTDRAAGEESHRCAFSDAGIQESFDALWRFEREPSTVNLDALIKTLIELGDRLGL